MFEYMYQWLQNLAFYMILVTAILHVIPNHSYEKYIRFFCGLILIIILAAPVMNLLGAEENLTQLYKEAKYRNFESELKKTAEYVTEVEEALMDEEEQ